MPSNYSPLRSDEFRLLSFLDDTGLSCTLQSYPRSEAPPYIALSYTWGHASYRDEGSSSLTYSIFLNNDDFPVQRNLYDALRHLGHHIRERQCLFWVDAICINQDDINERATQVRQMKEFYEGSNGIFAWLGIPFDEEETSLAVSLMDDFTKHLEGPRQHEVQTILSAVKSDHAGFPATPDSIAWKAWDGIVELLTRPHWDRLWVYQEVTTPVPITFFCGTHYFSDWSRVATMAMGDAFSGYPNFPLKFANASGVTSHGHAIMKERTRRITGFRRQLFELMQQTRTTACTNPSDRVYALLGHASDVPLDRITVDYDSCFIDLYVDVASFMLFESNLGLKTLGLVFMPTKESTERALSVLFEQKTPSWVPDWRQRVDLASFSDPRHVDEIGNPMYIPCPGFVDIHTDATVLHIKGVVAHKVDIAKQTVIIRSKRSWKPLYDWHGELMGQESSGSELDTAIRRSLVADMSRMHVNGKVEYKRGGIIDWSLFTTLRDSLDQDSRERLDIMRNIMFWLCEGRRLTILTNSRIALLPAAAEVGDKVAAFRGGNSLYLLRPLQEQRDIYTFIGECYVDGWMDGHFASDTGEDMRTIKLV